MGLLTFPLLVFSLFCLLEGGELTFPLLVYSVFSVFARGGGGGGLPNQTFTGIFFIFFAGGVRGHIP